MLSCRGITKPERPQIPAYSCATAIRRSQRDQESPEMHDVQLVQGHGGRDADQGHPPAATRSLPKRTGPVTKLGSEHGKDMPLDAKRRRIDRMAVPDLRHRRGGHQEGHQPEGHHPVATVSR